MRLISRFILSRWRLQRKNSRHNRLIRLRCTAQPTFLLTVIPSRVTSPSAGPWHKMKHSFCTLLPERESRIKRLRCNSLICFEKPNL